MAGATLWVGIDVSKDTIDVAVRLPERGWACFQFARTRAGVLAFLREMHAACEDRPFSCVMEATGGYSKELARWMLELQPEGHVAVVQPFRVKHFGHALGERNKTDALDAVVLARFGATFEPKAYHPMPDAYARLQALERERDALVRAATAMENRSELVSEVHLVQKVRARMLRHARKAIEELDEAILALVHSDETLASDFRRLQTVPGVGVVLATTLMGELGDLRAFDHPKKLAQFVGVAPIVRTSGSSVDGRPHMSKRGNGRVRKMLYMGAMAAIRGDTPFAKTYRHLCDEGKAPMSALGAIMRKLLITCRGVLVHNEDYTPDHVHVPESTDSAFH